MPDVPDNETEEASVQHASIMAPTVTATADASHPTSDQQETPS